MLPVVVVVCRKLLFTVAGKPVALRLTAPVNPFSGVTLIDRVLPAPGASDRLVVDDVRLKFGGAVTVSVKVLVWVMLPELPVTTMGYRPAAAVVGTEILRFVPVVELVCVSAAVMPAGTPETLKLTAPVNPDWAFTPKVIVVELPWTTATAGFDWDRLKVGVVPGVASQ